VTVLNTLIIDNPRLTTLQYSPLIARGSTDRNPC